MSTMSDLEAGKLIAAVELLTKEVSELKTDIEDIKAQLTKGKGIVIGMLLLASGAGAGVASVFDRIIG